MTNGTKNNSKTQHNKEKRSTDLSLPHKFVPSQKNETLEEKFKTFELGFPFEKLRDIDPEKDIPNFSTWDQQRQSLFIYLQEEVLSLLTIEDKVVEELNKKHACVHTGSFYILTEKPHTFIEGVNDFDLESRQSLIHSYENQLIRCSDGNVKSKAKIWLSHPQRRSYPNGITFDPSTNHHRNGFYNLWNGFAIVPEKGCCDLFKKHILEVICSDNKIYFNYLWKWCAEVCQHPHKIHTALLLMGLQGTGKGLFAKTIGTLFGKHYIHLDSVERLVGNFNFHMKNAVLVFADEAIWGGNRKDVGKLKAMVTEELAMIEQKGKDTIAVRNFRHFIFSSNEDWPVHLDPDDRRMFVLKVSDKHKEDDNYFKPIFTELENGGYAAILHELLNEDLSNFNPRHIPTNIEAFSVKMESATSVQKYLYEALKEGCFDIGNATPNNIWQNQIMYDSLFTDYVAWCSKERIPHEEREKLGSAISKHIRSMNKYRPSTKQNKRPYAFSIPELNRAREDFQTSFKVGSEIWD